LYDCIIIGGGPAGIAASIYAARQKINFLLITKDVGGQTAISSDIENYLGYIKTTGSEIAAEFAKQLDANNVPNNSEEEAVSIERKASNFIVKTNKGSYETKTILIASGKKPRKLDVAGEDRLYGHGVTYCATCEAPLFKDFPVAIVGGGNAAMDAAILCSNYATNVYIITINPELMGEQNMIDTLKKGNKFEVFYNAKTLEILGSKSVEGVVFDIGGNKRNIQVKAVFIEIGSIPSTDFDKLTEKNKWGEIIIHDDLEKGMTNLTSVPGIFAAGDITNVPEKQINVAAGEGVKAILSIFKYLNMKFAAY